MMEAGKVCIRALGSVYSLGPTAKRRPDVVVEVKEFMMQWLDERGGG